MAKKQKDAGVLKELLAAAPAEVLTKLILQLAAVRNGIRLTALGRTKLNAHHSQGVDLPSVS